MKKFVVGLLVGMLLAAGSSVAFAEISSMIGKKVDGQVPLLINGSTSDKPAVTIEGVSYIPLRAAGELFGYKVAWIDGEVVMEELQSGKTSQRSAQDIAEQARIEQEQANADWAAKDERMRAQNKAIAENSVAITNAELMLKSKKERVAEIDAEIALDQPRTRFMQDPLPFKETERYAKIVAEKEVLLKEIAALETELDNLETQKAALLTQQ